MTAGPVNRPFSYLSCTLATNTHRTVLHIHDTFKQPNQCPCQPPGTSTLLPTPCKCQFTGFFFLFLNTGNKTPTSDTPHVHATSKALPCQCQPHLSALYATTQPLLHQRPRKYQNMWVIKNHPCVSCLLRPPSHSALPGTNQDHPTHPHTTENRQQNTKTPLALPECASALPGNIGDDRAQLCTQF